jgi:hypothetical protein
MTTLKFESPDQRDLIDLLIEANRIAGEEHDRPSIDVAGTVYAPHDLLKVALLLARR